MKTFQPVIKWSGSKRSQAKILLIIFQRKLIRIMNPFAVDNNAKTERELEKFLDYIREYIDAFYVMDYSTMTSFVNISKLENKILENYENRF